MKGIYCLVICLKRKKTINIGKKLGKTTFNKGYYVYVGSAMNSLNSRIKRHLSDEKKLHWHIDYLLKESEVADVIYAETTKKLECDLSNCLSRQTFGIPDFGCSDCNCKSHLYYFKNKNDAIESIKEAYNSIALDWNYFRI